MGVTRNSVLQRGQRVSRLIAARTPIYGRRTEAPNHPRSSRLEIVPGPICFSHFAGLGLQYAGERQASAARVQVRDERCEHEQRLRENVRDNDIAALLNVLSRRDEFRIHAVAGRVLRGRLHRLRVDIDAAYP